MPKTVYLKLLFGIIFPAQIKCYKIHFRNPNRFKQFSIDMSRLCTYKAQGTAVLYRVSLQVVLICIESEVTISVFESIR